MTTRKSQKFASQIHFALYGETLEDKIKKDKILIIENLIRMNVLNVNQIAEAVNESIEFVTRIKENLNGK